MFTKIVVAIDNSPGSQRALELAKKLAKENGAHLDLVHVEEFLVGRAVGGQHANLLEDEIVTEIKGQATQLQDDGFDIALEVVPTVHGGPAHVVADVARAKQADVVVIGSRGHGPLAGVVLGSVAQRLVQIAPCPVLVVPPDRQATTSPASGSSEVAAAKV